MKETLYYNRAIRALNLLPGRYSQGEFKNLSAGAILLIEAKKNELIAIELVIEIEKVYEDKVSKIIDSISTRTRYSDSGRRANQAIRAHKGNKWTPGDKTSRMLDSLTVTADALSDRALALEDISTDLKIFRNTPIGEF